MTVTVENGTISVVSAYNGAWVARAKELGGKWNGNASAWQFPETIEDLVRDALMDIYGEDGKPTEKVTIDIKLDTEDDIEQSLVIAGVEFLTRRDRDSAVGVRNGAIIVKGSFKKSGGSLQYPRIGCPTSETVLRVQIPKTKLDSVGFDYTEVHAEPIDRTALEAEKEALLKRLAEIEELLK